ncbi:MAG: R2-like ligand-binding oxidase [Actinomycetota bacterium]
MTTQLSRYSTTKGGFRTDILPWRLYQKGKKLGWDPVDIDLTQDAKDWAVQDEARRQLVTGLATTFMAGEEAVTLDIMPLMRAIATEGRAEETLFLTTFISDEAHHAEFFRMWFDEVGHLGSVEDYLTDAHRRVFDEELPRAMGRLENDHSGEAFLDAALTYNHFVEGVLAMTGYWAWGRLFQMQEVFPGMKRGIELIQRDERRHLAYGTYLCRRIVADDPSTWTFVERRMEELRELGLEFLQDTADMAFGQVVKSTNMSAEEAEGMKVIADAVAAEFQQFGERALERRLAVIEVARGSSVADVELGTVEEEVEAEIEQT